MVSKTLRQMVHLLKSLWKRGTSVRFRGRSMSDKELAVLIAVMDFDRQMRGLEGEMPPPPKEAQRFVNRQLHSRFFAVGEQDIDE